MTTETAREPEAPEGVPVARRWPLIASRRRRVIGLALVVLVAGTAGGVWWRWDLTADAALAESRGDLVLARGQLEAGISLEVEHLESAAERVLASAGDADPVSVDKDSRLDLAGHIDDVIGGDLAADLVARLVAGEELLAQDVDGDLSRAARTHETRGLAASTSAAVEDLRRSGDTLSDGVQAWAAETAQAARTDALTQLEEAITSGEARLAATEGRVLDNAPREQLRAALDAAVDLQGAAVIADDVEALESSTQEITTAAGGVGEATTAVDAAEAAWQAEQDRIAAEQAAAAQAAAAAAQRRPATTSGGSTGTGSSRAPASGGQPAPATGGSAPSGGATEPDGSRWVESGSDTWCFSGDTSGAEGTGGWC